MAGNKPDDGFLQADLWGRYSHHIMELHQQVQSVCTKESLADFVAALRRDLENNPSQWENVTLNRFLTAMESWIMDMDQYYKNTGQEPPVNPTWKTFADMLYASRIYE